MPKRLEPSLYIGKKFNRYTIVREVCRHKRVSITEVECKCDCGTIKIVPLTKVIRGHSRSCGCYQKDVASAQSKNNITHGFARGKTKKIYDMYHNMLKRCYNEKDQYYEDYGGRGIKVCKEWRDSLEAFVTWCLQNGWQDGLVIDRKHNNKGYSPKNCQFVTQVVNNNNRRSNRVITVDGIKLSVTQHARRNGLKPCVVFSRLKYGWSEEKALKTPVRVNT